MSWWAVLILAAVQGLTEFLPVSSSGHLSLGHALLHADDAPVLFDVILHAGTLVGVIAFYRRDLLFILKDSWQALRSSEPWSQRLNQPGPRMIGLVVLATFPTAIIGLALKNSVEGGLRAPSAVAIMLLINGFLLYSSRYAPGQKRESTPGRAALAQDLTWKIALIIGVLQGLAVAPGISRSGITIIAAMWLGVAGEAAARFSFLLSIPAILGALLLMLSDIDGAGSAVDVGQLLGGAGVAALVGLASLVLLVRLLRDTRFHHFAWYCWAVGLVVLIAGY